MNFIMCYSEQTKDNLLDKYAMKAYLKFEEGTLLLSEGSAMVILFNEDRCKEHERTRDTESMQDVIDLANIRQKLSVTIAVIGWCVYLEKLNHVSR